MRNFAAALAVVALFASPALASELKPGRYRVAGTDSGAGAYTGEVELSQKNAQWRVRGVYVLASGKQSFAADAQVSGTTLTFSYTEKGNLLDTLGGIFGGGGNKKKRTTATYTIGGDALSGTWTASNDASFKRADTWTLMVTRIDAVTPATLPAGSTHLALTLTGRDLPMGSEVTGLAFTLDGAEDARIEVESIGERTDDATSLRFTVSVDKLAKLGARGIRLDAASKEAVATVVPGEPELPLGGSTELVPGQRAVLHVPLGGGVLTVRSSAGAPVVADATGNAIAGVGSGAAIKDAGTYHVTLEEGGTVSNTYVIAAETKPENKPYNFWYYPYYDRGVTASGVARNLYADGGVYEKLDALFGIKPASQKFDVARHMDSAAWVTTASRLFKMPEDPNEQARYDPSTMKGYAWCYQRSTDPSKSWWGHCWGAVIASSLHRAPKAKTVALPEGAMVNSSSQAAFSEEELEGVLSSYYSDHNVTGKWYVNRCPPGRPTDKTGEPVDAYAHDLWNGLVEGIQRQGVPLASNLRAESTDEAKSTEVWNHVVWRFEATLKRAPDQEDPSLVEVALKVTATNDVFPSDESKSPRVETYVLRLRTANGAVVANGKDQNWVSSSHFAPSYLARFTASTSGDNGCNNEVLGKKVGIAKLVETLGFEKNQ